MSMIADGCSELGMLKPADERIIRAEIAKKLEEIKSIQV